MTFNLATDGMTEAQVNTFKLHFKPGKYGVFIEDKLACRKAYARVSQIVTFNMVPFKIRKTFGSSSFFINEYKGDCRITFEFDNPYFEATSHYVDLNGEGSLEQKMRAVYINGTPHTQSWNKSEHCVIGGNQYFHYNENSGEIELQDIKNISGSKILNYYNPATAKTKAKIEVEFKPSFTNTFPVYFNNISDDINNPSKPYNQILTSNSIAINEDINELKYPHEFRFTSPDVIYSINKAIQMADNYTGSTALEFEEQLRLEIVNPKVMGWAAAVLRIIATKSEYYNGSTGNFKNGTVSVNCSYINMNNSLELTWKQYFNVYMLYMLATQIILKDFNPETNNLYDISEPNVTWEFPSYTIVFDGEQNSTKIYYKYNQILNNLKNFSVEGEESCGDMILSEYLNLDGGDTLTEEGAISTYHKLQITNEVQKMCLYYTPTYF